MVKKLRGKTAPILLLLAVLLIICVPLQANAAKQRVFDDAGVLNEKELNNLEKFAEKYSDKRQVDFFILTNKDTGVDAEDYMGDFYDEHEPGSAVILTIDLTERDVVLSGFGKARYTLPDERLDSIRGKVTPALSSGEYEKAFKKYIKLSAKYMQYKEGANPANPIYNIWVQLGLALLIGTGIVSMMAKNRRVKSNVNAETYFNHKLSKVNAKRDKYIRTSVTKRRRPKSNSSGSGRSGGGRSGGVTRGGSSYSRSRGKF